MSDLGCDVRAGRHGLACCCLSVIDWPLLPPGTRQCDHGYAFPEAGCLDCNRIEVARLRAFARALEAAKCPAIEEHDALQHMTTRALRAEAEVERRKEEAMTKKKPTADSGYESRIGELEARRG